MTVHIGYIELCRAVTADGNVSNMAIEVKMATVHMDLYNCARQLVMIAKFPVKRYK